MGGRLFVNSVLHPRSITPFELQYLNVKLVGAFPHLPCIWLSLASVCLPRKLLWAMVGVSQFVLSSSHPYKELVVSGIFIYL